MSEFSNLIDFIKGTIALGQISGSLSWDQETMMASGSIEQRSQWMGHLQTTIHERKIDPRISDWLNAIDPQTLNQDDAAQVKHISRDFNRSVRIPADLASAIAITTSRSQLIWAQSRSDENFKSFVPVLSEVVNLKRREAEALSSSNLYDALLNDFEPGMTTKKLDKIFEKMRPRLISVRDKALGGAPTPRIEGLFSKDLQLSLSNKIADLFGYDFNRGRLDLAVHPFSSGSGDDVRITTRVIENDPFNCLYSTIHEVGHATYEQNINHDYSLTPLGAGVSMGVHESQSRMYENQIGRSKAFTQFLFHEMLDIFGEFGIKSADEFYRCVNAVRKGYIRTEADEIQYNLHIMLRYELEQALINGSLEVKDLEVAWNDMFKRDFGYAVDRPSNGVLQDVHWSVGLFGYFPTYSLGNIYAGCLEKAIRSELPDLNLEYSKGNVKRATTWLRENLQMYGGLRDPEQTISFATGEMPNEEPLLNYLDKKFNDLI